jgi:hypothetical protein
MGGNMMEEDYEDILQDGQELMDEDTEDFDRNIFMVLALLLEADEDESSSDESMEEESRAWGGSGKGKSPNKKRNFERAYAIVKEQYFNGEESIYNETDFERRFGMPQIRHPS